jgi:hypothetical protein
MYKLSHSLYSDTLFVGEKYEYLIGRIGAGISEEIELIATTIYWSMINTKLQGCPKEARTQQHSRCLRIVP